jgi:hypothetical protein
VRQLIWTIGIVGALAALSQGAAAVGGKGFYRVAELEGAWWFIAPDGSRFFSSGVNVVDVGGKPAEYDPQRPEYAAFRHYPNTAAWARATQQRLSAWGFNTIGGWSAREMTCGSIPYTVVLHLGRELGVPWVDMLNPEFADQVAALTKRQVTPLANDSRLIGWYSDNELAWFADTLFVFHIAQSPQSVSRNALVDLLRKRYDGDFARLEEDFVATGANSFDELAAGGKLVFRPGGHGVVVADEFLRLLAERFYKTTHDAIRRCDANHLVLGDRYHGYCPDAVAKAAGPYVDVISTNFDQPDWTDGRLPTFYLERLHELTHRPVLVTEYYVAARENRSGNKNSGNIFTTVTTQRERAQAVGTRLSYLAALPYVVGAHWFQFSDEPTNGRSDGEDYNFGLVDIDDRPYQEVVAAFTKANAELPRLHAAAGLAPLHESVEPLSVPQAPLDPLSGVAPWDQGRARVPCGESSGLGDLLVTWDADRMYIALGCSTYVDENSYTDKMSAERDQLVWQFALDDGPPVRVGFGVNEDMTVSDKTVLIRLHQRGLRYTVIVAVPKEQFGRAALEAGDRLRLVATLTDPRHDTKTSWNRQLVCGPSIRAALSQQEPAPH